MHFREYFSDEYNNKCSLQQKTPLKDDTHGEILIHISGQRGGLVELNRELVKLLLPGITYFAEHGKLPDNVNTRYPDNGLFTYEDYENREEK